LFGFAFQGGLKCQKLRYVIYGYPLWVFFTNFEKFLWKNATKWLVDSSDIGLFKQPGFILDKRKNALTKFVFETNKFIGFSRGFSRIKKFIHQKIFLESYLHDFSNFLLSWSIFFSNYCFGHAQWEIGWTKV
jgi:hypothetical protein